MSKKKRTPRNDLREMGGELGGLRVPRLGSSQWRNRQSHDELADTRTTGGRRPGAQRCGALGLALGDCSQPNVRGRAYCYYHSKLATEFTAYAERRFSPGFHGKHLRRCNGNATYIPGVVAVSGHHQYQCFDCGTRFAVLPRPQTRGRIADPTADIYPVWPLPAGGYIIHSHPALKEAV